MTAIITNKYRVNGAGALKNEFLNSLTDRNYYIFIARVTPWSDETSPPTPLDTVEAENTIWHHMIAMKKIKETSVSHALRRLNWDSSGETIYFPYDHQDSDYFDHPTASEQTDAAAGNYNKPGTIDSGIASYTAGGTYVITDEYHVYKCISNRNSDNEVIKSSTKPTGTSTAIIETADGYRWKYMFTIQASDVQKFVTNDWIPVKKLSADDGSFQWDVQDAAVDGAIEHIRVENEGSGYTKVHNGTAQAGGASNIP